MLKASFEKKVLKFKTPAGTSRGILYDRPIWLLNIWDEKKPEIIGEGECSPLVKLSIDDRSDFDSKLQEVCENINDYASLKDNQLLDFPAIRIGIEMAFYNLNKSKSKLYFGEDIYPNIAINGLIWMGDYNFMIEQINRKLEEKWECIKIKIGAIDFQKELDILKYIRSKSTDVELRVDANGAFDMSNVYDKLEALSEFKLHSIEQPIQQGQWNEMAELCSNSPIPVGLDEELIGVYGSDRIKLLDKINPQYIVIKPTLVGGFALTDQWIKLAEERNIGWWITSTLEGEVGLTSLRQYVAQKNTNMHQGLGTGVLFV